MSYQTVKNSLVINGIINSRKKEVILARWNENKRLIFVNYKTNEREEVSFVFNYLTGASYTPVESDSILQPGEIRVNKVFHHKQEGFPIITYRRDEEKEVKAYLGVKRK